MAQAAIRTAIMDLLDREGVAYRRLPHDGPVFTVEAAAKTRGVRVEEMVKSILLRDKGGRYVMGCVTGEAQIDPQAAAGVEAAELRHGGRNPGGDGVRAGGGGAAEPAAGGAGGV
jgi:hypothetical protein